MKEGQKMTWVVCMCVRGGLHNSETAYLRRKNDENAWRDEPHSLKTELTRTHKIKNGKIFVV